MKFAEFLGENIQKQNDQTDSTDTDKKPEKVANGAPVKKPEKESTEDDKNKSTDDADTELTDEEKKKKKKKEEDEARRSKPNSDNKEYDVRDLKESFDKDFQHKIEGYIVDACREMKISIRAVEFEDNSVTVHYSHGKEAPEGYRDDKNELAKDIKDEVKDIFDEQGHSIKGVLRSTVAEGVASITFFINNGEKKDAK